MSDIVALIKALRKINSTPSFGVPMVLNEGESVVDLTTKGININSTLADALINQKGIEFGLNQAPINGNLNYNGDWSINANTPALGGNLNFDASRKNGSNAFNLLYRRSF